MDSGFTVGCCEHRMFGMAGCHGFARTGKGLKDQDGDHLRSGMGLRDADSPARWQDAVETGQTGTRTFRNDHKKVRMTI